MMKRLSVLALASIALIASSASADVSAGIEIVDYASVGGSGSLGSTQYSVSLYLRQSRSVGLAQTGTTVTPTNQNQALTIQGSLFICDYSDFDPCTSSGIPSQPAVGGAIEPLGNAVTFSGFVSTTSMGVVPLSLDARRPTFTSVNPPTGQIPNVWVDGTTVHADATAWESINRSGYATSVTMNAVPMTYGNTQYGTYLNPSTTVQN